MDFQIGKREAYYRMLYETEVRQCLGPKVVDCLLDAVDRGDLSLQQAEDLARGLHPTAGGNFQRAKDLPNFRYDRTSLRQILSDWYLLDWPGGESGVILEKLLMVLEQNEENQPLIQELKGIKDSEDQVQNTSLV